MAEQKWFFSLVVTVRNLTGNGARGMLDMLRYDTANVLEVHEDYVSIRTPRRPTDARWLSFGFLVLGTSGPHTHEWQARATQEAIAVYNERVAQAAAKVVAEIAKTK